MPGALPGSKEHSGEVPAHNLLRASVALAVRASCRHETPLNEKKPMRPSFLICALALLAIPASTVSSQAPSMTDSGIYFEAGGGLALFSEIGKVKSGTWYEEDGEPFYYDGTTKKDGTPTLKEADYDAGYDIGWAIGGAVGYRFGDIRAEAEVFYFSASQNRLGSADINKDVFDTPPTLSALSLMAICALWLVRIRYRDGVQPIHRSRSGRVPRSFWFRSAQKRSRRIRSNSVVRMGVCVSGRCRRRDGSR